MAVAFQSHLKHPTWVNPSRNKQLHFCPQTLSGFCPTYRKKGSSELQFFAPQALQQQSSYCAKSNNALRSSVSIYYGGPVAETSYRVAADASWSQRVLVTRTGPPSQFIKTTPAKLQIYFNITHSRSHRPPAPSPSAYVPTSTRDQSSCFAPVQGCCSRWCTRTCQSYRPVGRVKPSVR